MAEHHRHELAILAGGILIGLIGIFVKLIGDSVPAMSLSFLRLFFAFLVTLAIAPLIDKNTFKINKQDIKDYIFVGFLMAITFSFYVLAMLNAPVSNVVLIASLYILFVAVFAYFILKEKINKRFIIYLPLALVGLYLIYPLASFALGNLFAFFNAIFFALLIIYLKKERKKEGLGAVMWYFLFASLFLSPFVFIYGIGDLFKVIHWVLLLSIAGTSFVYLLIMYGLKKARANKAAIISFVSVPLAAILFAYFLIDEALPKNILVAGALLLTAGLIAVWKKD